MIHWFTRDSEKFPDPKKLRDKTNVVFFDGVCLMCNTTVKFLLRADTKQMLLYAPLQGDTFKKIGKDSLELNALETIVFVEAMGDEAEKIHTRSTAIVRILYCIGGFSKFLSLALFMIPMGLRDRAYCFIADHRYRWFGKTESICDIPSESERRRFLS